MKRNRICLSFSLACLTSQLSGTTPLFAANLPDDCEVVPGSFCVASSVDTEKKQVDVTIYAFVDKVSYPTLGDVTGKYFAFERWPEYAQNSQVIKFSASTATPAYTPGQYNYTHHSDYKIFPDLPVIGRASGQSVTADTVYKKAESQDADLLVKFAVDLSKSKGVNFQEGSIAVSEKADHFLVVLQSSVRPALPAGLGLNFAAQATKEANMDMLTGMFQLQGQ